MKFYVSFFAVFAVFNFSHLSLAKAEITKAGNYDFSVKSGKQDRSYSLHVPTKYNPKNKYPLVLAFHGAVGDMSLPADDSSYGLKAKADKEGYLIAFPKGYSKSAQGQMTWNAGACCGEAKDQKIDDVAFVKALVKNIKKEVNVDSERIFAVGMS